MNTIQDEILLLLQTASSLNSNDLLQRYPQTLESLYAVLNPLVVANYI